MQYLSLVAVKCTYHFSFSIHTTILIIFVIIWYFFLISRTKFIEASIIPCLISLASGRRFDLCSKIINQEVCSSTNYKSPVEK